MSNRQYEDDFDEYEDELTVGCGSGRGEYFANPIGFGKELSAPFRIPIHLVYDATGKFIDVRLYTTINGTTYELQPTNEQDAIDIASKLYDILGAKHYEHD